MPIIYRDKSANCLFSSIFVIMSGQRRVSEEQERRFSTFKVKRLLKVDIRCTFHNVAVQST